MIGFPPGRLFGILRQFSPIGPDDTPFLVEFVQDHHVGRCLDDPAGPEIMQNDARESLRIAGGNGIVGERGRDHSISLCRYVRRECLAPQSCIRWLLGRSQTIGYRRLRVVCESGVRVSGTLYSQETMDCAPFPWTPAPAPLAGSQFPEISCLGAGAGLSLRL